jgi:hypothetical protein
VYVFPPCLGTQGQSLEVCSRVTSIRSQRPFKVFAVFYMRPQQLQAITRGASQKEVLRSGIANPGKCRAFSCFVGPFHVSSLTRQHFISIDA